MNLLHSDFAGVVEAANALLSRSSNYVFSHLSSYDHYDIRFLRASTNFARGESYFSDSINDINFLSGELGLSINIDPSIADTWMIGDTSYQTLAAVIAEALAVISEAVSP